MKILDDELQQKQKNALALENQVKTISVEDLAPGCRKSFKVGHIIEDLTPESPSKLMQFEIIDFDEQKTLTIRQLPQDEMVKPEFIFCYFDAS